jgi:hypothetical protein
MCEGFDRRRARTSPRRGWLPGAPKAALGLSRGWGAKPQDHLALTFTGPALAPQRRKGNVINPYAHTLAAAVVGSSLASAERSGVEARGVGKPAFGRLRLASGPRRFNDRRRARCCSVRS